MARTAEGWKLVWKRGIAHVRFRLQGRRHEVSTRERDPSAASRVASQVYADFVSGSVRRAASGALIHPNTALDELCADWIADVMPELGENTDTTYEVYARHWCAHFSTIGNVRTPAIGDYQRKRLGSVQRSTIIKERGGLRRFLTWCFEKELIAEVPEFPKLPKKALGKKHRQGRSAPKIELSPTDVDRILAELPEQSLRSRKGKRYAVRAYFVACYETGLRPEGTIDRIVGRDITLAGLHIRPECDKNRWERVVPLTGRARAAFASAGAVGPDEPVFGVRERRVAFRQACLRALGEERGKLVTPYDLKHARATHLEDAGASRTGIAFLTGTDAALDRYIHPNRRAAEAALGCLTGAAASGEQCEGGDLNPHGNNPASTSSEFNRVNAGKRRRAATVKGSLSGAQGDLSGARHPDDSDDEFEWLATLEDHGARAAAFGEIGGGRG